MTLGRKSCYMESWVRVQAEGVKPGRSALHSAAHSGDVNQVLDLLQRGYPVRAASRLPADEGAHALHLAVAGGHVSLVEVLLNKGADPDAGDQKGFRPLHVAAQRGSVEVVKLLNQHGANLQAQTKKIGLQAVHLAARNGHVQVLSQLQTFHCNLAALDLTNATPLHHAAQSGNLKAVEWLIKAGVSHDDKDEEGKSVLDRAKEGQCYQGVAAAISRKASESEAAKQRLRQPVPSPTASPIHRSPASSRVPYFKIYNAKIPPPSPLPPISPITPSAPEPLPPSRPSLTSTSSTLSQHSPPLQASKASQDSQPPPSPPRSTREEELIGTRPPTLPPPTAPVIPSSPHLPSDIQYTSPPSPPDSPISLPIHDTFKPSTNVISPQLTADPSPPSAVSFLATSTPKPTNPMKKNKKDRIVKVLKRLMIPFPCEDSQGRRAEESGTEKTVKYKISDGRVIDPGSNGRGRELPRLPPYIFYSKWEMPILDFRVQATATPFPHGPRVYSCATNPRGHVLILNYKSFRNNQYPTRFGSECDIINLENVYHQMGFTVDTRWDLTRKDTLQFLSEASRSPSLQHVSCLFVFIMSHGDGPRTFHTYDLAAVTLDEVLSFFLDSCCPQLQGKPKILFSHFCRGTDEEIRPKLLPEAKREAYRDTLCIYSSTEGFQAYRHPMLGTPSIRAFCWTLAQHAHREEISQIIKKFQSLYATMEGATSPEVQNLSFEKDFFFNPTGSRTMMR